MTCETLQYKLIGTSYTLTLNPKPFKQVERTRNAALNRQPRCHGSRYKLSPHSRTYVEFKPHFVVFWLQRCPSGLRTNAVPVLVVLILHWGLKGAEFHGIARGPLPDALRLYLKTHCVACTRRRLCACASEASQTLAGFEEHQRRIA